MFNQATPPPNALNGWVGGSSAGPQVLSLRSRAAVDGLAFLGTDATSSAQPSFVPGWGLRGVVPLRTGGLGLPGGPLSLVGLSAPSLESPPLAPSEFFLGPGVVTGAAAGSAGPPVSRPFPLGVPAQALAPLGVARGRLDQVIARLRPSPLISAADQEASYQRGLAAANQMLLGALASSTVSRQDGAVTEFLSWLSSHGRGRDCRDAYHGILMAMTMTMAQQHSWLTLSWVWSSGGSLLNEHPFKKTSQDRLSVARQGLEQLVMDLRGHGMTHGSVTQIVGADGGGDGDHDNGPGASASVAATTPGPAPLRTSPLAPVTSLDFGAADACRTPRQTRRVWRKGEVAAAATTAGATGNGGAGAGAGGASTAAAPTGGNILITGLKNADCGSSGSRSIGDGTCSVSFGGLAGPIWGLGTAAGAEGEEDEEEEEDGVFDDCAGGVTSLSQQTGGEEETGDPAVAQDLAGLLGTGTESAASALRRSASVPMFAMERPGELEGMGLAAGNTGGGGAVRTRFTNRPISFLSKRSPGKSQLSTTGWHTPRARLPVLRRCSTAAPGGGGGGADAGGGDGATAVCTRRPHLRTVNAGAGWGSRHLSGSSSRSGHVLLPSGTAAGGGGSGGMVCGVLLLSGGGAGGGVEGSEQKDSCSGSKILWPPGLQPLPPPPPLLARVLNLGRGVAGGTAAVAAAAAMVPPDPVPYNSKPAATLQEATATMPTGPPHGFVAASGGQRHPPYASKHMSQMALLPFLQQQQQQSSSTLLPVALSAPGSFNLAALSREITGLRWIGQGGGGAVFQGMWQGVSVAVKFLLTEADGLVDAAALEGVVSSVVLGLGAPTVDIVDTSALCGCSNARPAGPLALLFELLESLMESCTTFSDSNNHVRRARALHIAASGGNFGAFALASCPGGGSGGVCAAVQRLSRLGVPSLGELGPLTSAQLAPPCSTDGGGGEVVTPGGAGRSWGAPLLASCRARSIPPGSSRTLGTAAAAAAATATAVTPVAASPDTSAGAAAAGTAAGVAVETAADAAVGPPTARGGGGLPRALRSWFVDIWGQQSPPVIQPSPPLLRHPQPPSSPSRSASLMAMLRARSQVRQGHPPSPSASGPAVALAVATGTDESDADVVIARSGGDGCFRPASAAAALGRGRGSGSGSAAVTVTAAAAAAGSAHAAAVDSTSYGPVIGSLFSGASTAAGWNCHAKLNSTFHSDDGFGDPEAGMGTQCWTVRQVLSYLKARPGMYLTYIIMEYCDRGSLLSAIKRGVFQTDSMWPHDKDKDKDGLGGGAGGGGGSTGTGTGGGGGGGGAWSLWTSSTTFGRNNLTAPPNRPPRNTATTTTTATITATASPASSITVALPTAEFPLGLHDQQQQQQQQLSSAPSGTASSSRRVVLRALLRTARDVAQGMCHLHSNGIIHGDLKPGNVLLRGCRSDRRGFTALVSDFGLSKVTRGEKPLDLNHWSTVTVMAPEVINGTWLKASDVFSFGILLWQLVTGEIMPYGTCTVPQILVGVSQGSLKPEWPSSAHPALVRLGRACLSTSPEKRPKFEAIVKRATAPVLPFLAARFISVLTTFQTPNSKLKKNSRRTPTTLKPLHRASGCNLVALSGATQNAASTLIKGLHGSVATNTARNAVNSCNQELWLAPKPECHVDPNKARTNCPGCLSRNAHLFAKMLTKIEKDSTAGGGDGSAWWQRRSHTGAPLAFARADADADAAAIATLERLLLQFAAGFRGAEAHRGAEALDEV
ncbi:hypothetical protein VOLCADRAFT_106555 [Volvox carteri f. nagariensis]|uniref:Protein kinase domain-containing protein n=1 Tax=Volvox carteri f. nagariensis TaxID=3068 RepID=D8U849_VOLCA|nr:uncharacterized protein VOLCADRAFT_106555 [Volvox carteri f. nagariensis]EFJ44078.1 hypothetical protein VOLCADRAFT_106555 [Volvox carteri f. nagariensis]|eukprot:XP_002954879.1 hypothetical protein VOLCADRAFT_106555 [Volvox carteri f. nagariensis]